MYEKLKAQAQGSCCTNKPLASLDERLKIKEDIYSATTSEEVQRLGKLLQQGHVSGNDRYFNRPTSGGIEEKDDWAQVM